MFIVPGIVRALAATFKLGKRSELLEVAERLWTNARDLADSPAAKASTLTRKLACKLTQRIGLLFLKPRLCLGGTNVARGRLKTTWRL